MEAGYESSGPDRELLSNHIESSFGVYRGKTEWWQQAFADLESAKSYITDPALITEIDAFIGEYGDLRQWIRKDRASMEAASRTIDVLNRRVLVALSQR